MKLRKDAAYVIENTLKEINPHKAVQDALKDYTEKAYIFAIGKAAWTMGKAAWEALGERALGGVVITKYDHSMGEIGNLHIFEAGHPLPDENSVAASEYALNLFGSLNEGDNIIFLISGGGSALFESPEDGVSLKDVEGLSKELILSGADIKQINTVRKRISRVKGGKFAKICDPVKIYSIILSDVLGDDPGFIASGPAYADSSGVDAAIKIIEKYDIKASGHLMPFLKKELPATVTNAETRIIGSVAQLCKTVSEILEGLGYTPYVLTENMSCQAREAGALIGSIAAKNAVDPAFKTPCAIIFGGETVVKVTGKGSGGRNQEIALSAASHIGGLPNVCIFSLGSDGTDGPTDAAGGVVDGTSYKKYLDFGTTPEECLNDNDAYNLLKACGDLLVTGPTGTNVNDVTVILISGEAK
ncbi:MAG: glycerate kinase [Defluviitaleaceae bacterium]|nr:glycerate kinase [Defluviitaleaceae bacterium]